MHILVITWEYPPYVVGGMGKHVAELVPSLGGQLVDGEPLYVDVLTTHYAGGPSIEQFNEFTTIYRIDTPPLDPLDLYNSVVANNLPLIEAARELGLLHSYDLIHVHDWLTGEAGVTLKHEWKVPLITTVHATERGRHQGHLPSATNYSIDRMEWRTCYEAWRIIVCSRFMRDELHHYFGTPLDKIDVIPNGVLLPQLEQCGSTKLTTLRTRYAPNDEHLLFYVGRIVYEKGLHVLLQAMPTIVENYPNVRLLVAGKNGHKMRPMAQRLGIESNVHFLGFVSNEERDCLYQVVDAAIFPSLYEPFGIVALEAMANGCNVIASHVGGLGEVIKHRQNGLTVYPDDPESIYWAVEYLFQDGVQAQQRRLWANYEVRTRYNWSNIAQRTARIYNQVRQDRLVTDW